MAKRIGECRACGGELQEVLELGEFALCGHFPKLGETSPKEPMGLSHCGTCDLVQMHYSYDREFFGENYGYRSGLNASMVQHLSVLALEARTRIALEPADTVLDIGGNDGTLLASLPSGLRKVLIDPTAGKWDIDPSIEVIPEFFTGQCDKARLVFSISMFYDLEDPVGFARNVASVLADDGLWVLEQSYLHTMLKRTAFDTICHEHLEYYSLKALEFIMDRAGLEVVHVALNDCNGGSIRLTVAHKGAYKKSTIKLIEEDAPKKFHKFQLRMEGMREHLLEELKQAGRVLGYGASTKGNTLLQWCGIGRNELGGVVDVNPDKWWKTTATGITIMPEKWAGMFRPDAYLVLPWHFKDFIVQKEQEFLKSGGKLIFPLPTVQIHADSLDAH